MAFGSTNNSQDKKSTNTRGIQFRNKNGFDPSAISFNFWDEFLAIRINPALPQAQQTNTKVYDYEKTVSTALSVSKMALLLNRVRTVIVPAITAGEDKTVGVSVGGDSLICVGTGKALTGEIRPYIAIHKSLNQETMKPEMSIYYEFNKDQSIDDYDAKTGKYNCVNGLNSEFLAFELILEASIYALTRAEAHADRLTNQWANDRQSNLLNSIAEKLGLSVQSNNNGYSSRNSISFNSNSNNSDYGMKNETETEILNDINGIDEFLN